MRVVAQEAINYIEGRRTHNIVSLKTRWNKFNKQCMGGVEPNTVMTIAGISGAGKSSMVNSMMTDIIDLNKTTNQQVKTNKRVQMHPENPTITNQYIK